MHEHFAMDMETDCHCNYNSSENTHIESENFLKNSITLLKKIYDIFMHADD